MSMRKNMLALMLSFVMVSVSIGGTSAFAAESTGNETTAESAIEDMADNEIVDAETSDEESDPLEGRDDTAEEFEPEQAEGEKETVSDSEKVEESEKDTEESTASVTGEPSAPEEEIIETNEIEHIEDDQEAELLDVTSENAAQAVLTKDDSTLTFYYGPQVYAGDSFNGKRVYDVWSGSDVTNSGSKDPKWINTAKSYTKYVIFDSSFLNVRPASMYRWFSGFYKLESVDTSGLDTSNVTDMSGLFSTCYVLSSLDVSSFDTSDVTGMSGMFQECNRLTSLDVSGFDTSNVTSMSYMFYGCSRLKSVDVSGFDTSNVTNMAGMFRECSALTKLDVSGFDTSNVTNMYRMFTYCSSITSLDVSSFDVSHVTSFGQMFDECSSLRTIYCKDSSTNWGNDKDEMMFASCTSLVGTAGDAQVRFNSGQTGSSMAKSANLGGYFTPKPVTVEFFIEFTNLDNVIHLGETAVGAIMTASVASADVKAEMKNTVWSIENPEYATIEKMGPVVGNAVQFSINAKRPGKTNLIATLSDGSVISREIIIEPKMTVSVGAKLNNGKIDEIDRVISYSNVWCSVSLEGYEADKEYLDYFIQNVTYNKEEIEAAAEIIEDIEETTFVSEDGLTAWKKLRIGHKENKESNSVHVVFTSPEKVRAEKYFYAQKDRVAELTYRASGTKWAGDGHHSFLFSDSYFYHDSNVYSNDLAVMSLGLELSAWTSHDYDDNNADIIPTGREKNLRDAFLKLGFKNPVFFKYNFPNQ